MADADNGQSRAGFRANIPVFVTSAILIAAFVALGAVWPTRAGATFAALQDWIIGTLDWYYVLVVAVFLVFVIGIALSSFGRVRLGPDDSEPEFTYGSWFAMLFSAGMGIGLLFFGVAEPMMHYLGPPRGEGETIAAAREALQISFFHWGVHAWAIYAVVGLSLAYFSFRHNLPLTIRSALYPLIGERIYGPIGHVVDIFAVLGTMLGVATSLGLGVLQVNAGLAFLFDAPATLAMQLILIALITLIATVSVMAGLERGIKRLSELNLVLALFLLVFVLVTGPTVFLLEALVQNLGGYLGGLVEKTFTLYAYDPIEWIGGWTLFYWGWWMAWSPFVGMFIARVSRGRTIREFVGGVLFVPVGFTFMWLTVFGNTAIATEMAGTGADLVAAVNENVPTALFTLLAGLPWSAISSLVATALVITFFVTSADSGALVIDIITSGGVEESPVWQRVFWAVTVGVVAAVLLVAGGLDALQTASIAGALPFSVVMLLICYGLYRGLVMERLRSPAEDVPARIHIAGTPVSWQRRLRGLVAAPRREQVAAFLQETAAPALQRFADEVIRQGLRAEIETTPRAVALTIFHGDHREFVYEVRVRSFQGMHFAFPELPERRQPEVKTYRVEAVLPQDGTHYDVMGYSQDNLIADILAQYEKHMHFMHLARRTP